MRSVFLRFNIMNYEGINASRLLFISASYYLQETAGSISKL